MWAPVSSRRRWATGTPASPRTRSSGPATVRWCWRSGNNRQFASLVEVLGVPELADDERYATNTQRVAHREQLVRDITAALATGSADEWFEKLTAQGVPCGPLNDIADAVALAERLGLNPVVEIDDPRRDRPVRQVANPIRLSATPASYRSAPPRLGEDTPAVSTC